MRDSGSPDAPDAPDASDAPDAADRRPTDADPATRDGAAGAAPGAPPRVHDAPDGSRTPHHSDAPHGEHAAPSDEPAATAPAERAQYAPEEQRAIREAVAAGRAPVCPRDGTPLTRRPIGGGSFGLGYARRREWLLCPVCRRSALFDVRRGTRN